MISNKLVFGAVLVIALAIGINAFIHSRLSKDEKVQRITEKMAKKLSLSEDQKTKLFK